MQIFTLQGNSEKPSHFQKLRITHIMRNFTLMIERVWKIIKYEFTFLYEWNSFSDLKEGLKSLINSYNKVRPHEALGYQTSYEVYRNRCFPKKGYSKEKTEVD